MPALCERPSSGSRGPGGGAGHGREGMTREPRQLRFGVMCAGTTFVAWEAECLDRLVALENTRLALLIIDMRAEARRVRPGPVDRVRRLLRSDRILWSARLQGVSGVACDMSRRGRFSECAGASNIVIIIGHGLDFSLASPSA